MKRKNKQGEAETQPLQPGLYLVASPIGHADDLSLRALETLIHADTVYCEDTRRSRQLFAIHNIAPKRILAAHAHNEEKAAADIVARVQNGESVAYISDAGMPLISDPGFILVRRMVEADLPVTSIPGANAVLTALQLSNLPTAPFYFVGFLPSRAKDRKEALENIRTIPATLVFYESPHRLKESIADMQKILGDRPAALARELTKLHEEMLRGTLGSILATLEKRAKILGECVLIVGAGAPEAPKELSQPEMDKLLKAAAKTLSKRDAAADVSEKTGIKKRDLYQRLIELDE